MGHAVGNDAHAVGTGNGHYLGAELGGFLHRTPGHVAEAGDGDLLASDVLAGLVEKVLGKVESAESGGFGTQDGSTPGHALPGKHSGMILACEFLVHSVQETDFAAAYAHIAGRDVLIGADAAPEFEHERLAETHDFGVALAYGIKIGSALGSTHGEGREGVLESLFETQELEHGRSDSLVEAETSLVGADCAIELHTVAEVRLHFAFVVDPGDTESEDTVGLDHPLHNLRLLEFGMLIVNFFNTFEHFLHCLKILVFSRMFGLEHRHYF